MAAQLGKKLVVGHVEPASRLFGSSFFVNVKADQDFAIHVLRRWRTPKAVTLDLVIHDAESDAESPSNLIDLHPLRDIEVADGFPIKLHRHHPRSTLNSVGPKTILDTRL